MLMLGMEPGGGLAVHEFAWESAASSPGHLVSRHLLRYHHMLICYIAIQHYS